jgi:hypothetical protein
MASILTPIPRSPPRSHSFYRTKPVLSLPCSPAHRIRRFLARRRQYSTPTALLLRVGSVCREPVAERRRTLASVRREPVAEPPGQGRRATVLLRTDRQRRRPCRVRSGSRHQELAYAGPVVRGHVVVAAGATTSARQLSPRRLRPQTTTRELRRLSKRP